jgi:hypothetical protein
MVKLLRRIINLFKKCKMAKINNIAAYAISSPVTADDIVIGSGGGNNGDTKNFQMSDISTYVLGNAVTPTLDDVCQQGASTTTGITVAGTTTLNGVLDANSTADISGAVTLGSTLEVDGLGTFNLGVNIASGGLAMNDPSAGIIVVGSSGIVAAGGGVSGTSLSTSGGLLVSGTSFLGEIDSAGPADIADTLTLSKASGTGLSLPSSNISVGGSTLISSTAVTADAFQTNSASFTATSSAVQCSVAATFSAFDSTLGGTFRLIGSVPSSSTDTGAAGQIAVDATHIYVCVGTDSWGRVAIDTTPF